MMVHDSVLLVRPYMYIFQRVSTVLQYQVLQLYLSSPPGTYILL